MYDLVLGYRLQTYQITTQIDAGNTAIIFRKPL